MSKLALSMHTKLEFNDDLSSPTTVLTFDLSEENAERLYNDLIANGIPPSKVTHRRVGSRWEIILRLTHTP